MTRIWCAVLLLLACAPHGRAATLRWAADAQSGAPYVFHDPAAPHDLTGYEADIIAAIAQRIHRDPVFVQNDWDGLIPGLQRGLYDVVIDGLEITPEHRAAVDFSVPYYSTFEQLAVRRRDRALNTLAALTRHPVGTLKASVGERILRQTPGIDVHVYEEEVNAYADLADGRIDAVLLDHPIARYYAAPDPRLALVGAPIGTLAYGIAVAPGNGPLRAQIDEALRTMQRDGSLRRILQRWDLWSPTMQALDTAQAEPPVAADAYARFVAATAAGHSWRDRLDRYFGFLPLVGRAALMTLEVSVVAMAIAIGAGLGLALLRVYGPRPASWMSMAVIEVVRGTPLLIQILFVFYGLPNIGVTLGPFTAGVLALGINYAAYEAENYRAGLQAVPPGQAEAAMALNMTRAQSLRHVIVPQAWRIVVPVMTNDFISLLKDSSLVSIITLTELSQTYVRLSTTYYDYFGTGLLIGAAYLLLGLPFVQLSRWAERRMSGRARARTSPVTWWHIAALGLGCAYALPIVVACSAFLVLRRPLLLVEDRSMASLLPAPADPTARVRVLFRRGRRLRSMFVGHAFLVYKPHGGDYIRYDWDARGEPIRSVGWMSHDSVGGMPPGFVYAADGADAARLIPLIEASLRAYAARHVHDYVNYPGPNSNTFIQGIIDGAAGMRAVLPPAAIGKDHPHDGRPIRRLHSGLLITLGGYAGCRIGWIEGLEINVLGLVLGLDWRRPAIKLPALGRIGMSACTLPRVVRGGGRVMLTEGLARPAAQPAGRHGRRH